MKLKDDRRGAEARRPTAVARDAGLGATSTSVGRLRREVGWRRRVIEDGGGGGGRKRRCDLVEMAPTADLEILRLGTMRCGRGKGVGAAV
jgi:hypothetical protein